MTNNYYKHYDKRTYDRYLEKGIVKKTDFDSHLKNLPDESQNAQWVQMDMDEAELTDLSEGSDLNDESSESGA